MPEINKVEYKSIEETEKILSCKDCEQGINMCKTRPCWGTPEDIEKIIESGFGKNLMLDYWCREGGDIMIVSPAVEGSERRNAPLFPTGRCNLLSKDNLCKLHTICKPTEGSVACCKVVEIVNKKSLHEAVAMTWDTEKGRKVVDEWKSKYLT